VDSGVGAAIVGMSSIEKKPPRQTAGAAPFEAGKLTGLPAS